MVTLCRRFVHAGWVAGLLCGLTLLPAVPSAGSVSSNRRTAIVRAVERVRPSVVNIHGRKHVDTRSDSQGEVNGMGTGIVIDPRGYILTNYHVIEGVSRIQVTLASGNTVSGRLIANDLLTDLAVLKIETSESLPVIPLGTSEDLMPGEPVVAVGNAYGYAHTVTRGIISALHRHVQVSESQQYDDLIQTDAAINPGNSGGPLLNIDGELIGINVAVRVGAQSIGFAIPVNDALEAVARVLAAERIVGVSHGLQLRTVYVNRRPHVEVIGVNERATTAGVREGDVLEAVAEQPVLRALDVELALLDHVAGEEVALRVARDGSPQSVALVLQDSGRVPESTVDRSWRHIGVKVSPISSSSFRQISTRYNAGLRIVAVREGSPAERQGIRRGDILVGIHKWRTETLDNLTFILDSEELRELPDFKFYVLRDGQTLFGHLQLENLR